MSKSTVNAEKTKLLNNLLNIYKLEVNAIYGVAVSWELLKPEAQDKCAEDFDQALIAREALLEELFAIKDSGVKVEQYESNLFSVDQELFKNSVLAKELYGLDVKSFLNMKTQKALPKANK